MILVFKNAYKWVFVLTAVFPLEKKGVSFPVGGNWYAVMNIGNSILAFECRIFFVLILTSYKLSAGIMSSKMDSGFNNWTSEWVFKEILAFRSQESFSDFFL